MIAPSCPSLLKRKLEIQNIQFIEADKIIEQIKKVDETDKEKSNSEEIKKTKEEPIIILNLDVININKASIDKIITAFRGSGMRKATIEMLILRRDKKPYKDLCEFDIRSKLDFSS